MNRLDIRSKLMAGGALPHERLVVQCNGEAVEVEMRGLSAGARGRVMQSGAITNTDGEQVVNLALFQPEVVALCTYVPDTNERVFEDTDQESIAELAAPFLDQLFLVASRLSGLSVADAKTAAGNSAGITASDSATSSLVSLVA